MQVQPHGCAATSARSPSSVACRWRFLAARSLVACVAASTLNCRNAASSNGLPTPPSRIRDASIELSMGPCHGSCPHFSITRSGNGALHWVGYRYVAAIGERDAIVNTAAVESVFGKVDTQFELWLAREGSECPARVAPRGAICALFGVPIDSS